MKRETHCVHIHVQTLCFTSEAALACLSVDPAVMLMVVGVLMFFLTFCGCVGSLRENICLLQTVSEEEYSMSITRC